MVAREVAYAVLLTARLIWPDALFKRVRTGVSPREIAEPAVRPNSAFKSLKDIVPVFGNGILLLQCVDFLAQFFDGVVCGGFVRGWHGFLLLDFALIFGWLLGYILGCGTGFRRLIIEEFLGDLLDSFMGFAFAWDSFIKDYHGDTW